MRFFISAVFILCIFPEVNYAQDTTKQSTFDAYQQQLEERFKQESWWYRTWNRYEVNPGFSKYNIGPSILIPLGYGYANDVFGIRYHNMHLELGAHFWKSKEATDVEVTQFYRISAGYFTPITKLKVGKRVLDVKGVLLQLAAGGGYTYTFPNHGIYVAPDLQLQLPFLVLSARTNVEYTFDGGLRVFPEVGVQLDALRTLLNPHKKKIGKINTSYATSTPIGGGWHLVESHYSSSDFYIKDVGPFWGITPRFGMAHSLWTPMPYTTYGIGISGRTNYFGADIHIDRGALQTGISKYSDRVDDAVKKDFDNEEVQGFVNTREFSIEANVDVFGLAVSLFKAGSTKKMTLKNTPLNRFNFHLGATYFKAVESVYANAGNASAYTNQFFADNPQIERNSFNDPLQTENGWGITYGLSYEMGAVGVKLCNKLSHTNGSGAALEVYYILPVTKILKVYK